MAWPTGLAVDSELAHLWNGRGGTSRYEIQSDCRYRHFGWGRALCLGLRSRRRRRVEICAELFREAGVYACRVPGEVLLESRPNYPWEHVRQRQPREDERGH